MSNLEKTLREEEAWNEVFEDGTACKSCEWCEGR